MFKLVKLIQLNLLINLEHPTPTVSFINILKVLLHEWSIVWSNKSICIRKKKLISIQAQLLHHCLPCTEILNIIQLIKRTEDWINKVTEIIRTVKLFYSRFSLSPSCSIHRHSAHVITSTAIYIIHVQNNCIIQRNHVYGKEIVLSVCYAYVFSLFLFYPFRLFVLSTAVPMPFKCIYKKPCSYNNQHWKNLLLSTAMHSSSSSFYFIFHRFCSIFLFFCYLNFSCR